MDKKVLDKIWNEKYMLAKAYYKKHGNLLIPRDYIVNDIKLGRWIQTQRQNYNKNDNSYFTMDKINKLNNINMVWDCKKYNFNKMYLALVKYKEMYGDTRVPQDFITNDDLSLGSWVNKQRMLHKSNKLSKKKINMFNKVGMVWNPKKLINDKWNIYYKGLIKYINKYNKTPNCNYIADDGLKLGSWLSNQRHRFKSGTLLQERKEKLMKLNILENKNNAIWQENYSYLKKIYDMYGHIKLDDENIKDEKIRKWICRQKKLYKKNKLSKERLEKLNQINFDFNYNRNIYYFNRMYNEALEYYKKNNTIHISKNKKSSANYNLAIFLDTQRSLYRKGKLSDKKIKLFEDIGMKWNLYKSPDEIWNNWYTIAKDYYKKNNHLMPPTGKLRTWLFAQRAAKKGLRGKISKRKIKLLDDIGMVWNVKKTNFDKMYKCAKQYYKIHGILNIPCNYVTSDNVNLGMWISRQRRIYKNVLNQETKLTKVIKERIKKLNNIGMIWDASKISSNASFQEKAIYYYMKKFFKSTVKMTQFEFIGYELDIYIPEIKTAIEYDGIFHMDKLISDGKKNEACHKNGIRIIRIREKPLPNIHNCNNVIITDSCKDKDLEKSINKLFKILDINYTCDILRDKKEIIETYKNYVARTFDRPYEIAFRHYKKYGCISSDKSFLKLDGKMKAWIYKQRYDYKNGTLTKLQQEKLEKIGIILDVYEAAWQKNYEIAKKYCETHKKIMYKSVSEEGFSIGSWLYKQKKLNFSGKLSSKKAKLLEDLDINYFLRDIKKENIIKNNKYQEEIKKYYKLHGNIDIKRDYVTKNNLRLGKWLAEAKRKYKKGLLSKEKENFFNKYGIAWYTFDDRWEKMFNVAKQYFNKHGNILISANYVTNDDIHLGDWISRQRQKYFKYKNYKELDKDKIDKLNSIKMIWDPYNYKWMEKYNLAKKYYNDNGNLNIPSNYITENGIKLGMWICCQRKAFKGNPNYLMTEERKKLLDDIKMDWKVKN